MDMKRLAIGTVVGAITLQLVGYLIWNIVFDFYFAAVDASGVAREPQLLWANMLGNLSLAALLTLAIDKVGASTIGRGIKIGAIVGFLVWFGVDFAHYAVMTVQTLMGTIVDPLLELIRYGVTGGVIVAVLKRG